MIFPLVLNAQLRIKGTVYDLTGKRPLESVSVISTSGNGTVTDMFGSYTLFVNQNDSIYFSYLNKPTQKFAVSSITLTNNFDISLHVAVTELPMVKVTPRNYRMDSIQNRLDYAKAFNFKKPGLSIAFAPQSGAGVGLDLTELINVFRFKRNRSMLAFQKRLLQEEQDKYIDHRFSKAVVKRLTGLTGKDQELFMRMFKPEYEFVLISTDYELQDYIKLAYLKYRTLFAAPTDSTKMPVKKAF